jgi:hypothetical protein
MMHSLIMRHARHPASLVSSFQIFADKNPWQQLERYAEERTALHAEDEVCGKWQVHHSLPRALTASFVYHLTRLIASRLFAEIACVYTSSVILEFA